MPIIQTLRSSLKTTFLINCDVPLKEKFWNKFAFSFPFFNFVNYFSTGIQQKFQIKDVGM